MKKLSFLFSLLLICSALPLAAQTRSVDILGFASWVDVSGDTTFDEDADDFGIEFESDQGWGGAVNVFWGSRFSTEFAASIVSPEVNVDPTSGGIPPFLAGEMEMIPITATLQFHLAPAARFNPYIGAGVAYVLFDDVEDSGDLGDIDVESIEFEDDYGVVFNAGLDIGVTDMMALNVDAKYVPVESSATAVFTTGPGETAEVSVNPLIISAGLRLKF